jgi:uncharacterized protein (DUF4415 family)
MKKEYDFSKGKRGSVIEPKSKTRVTMYLDDDVLEEFRTRANRLGKGYQTLINETLREQLGTHGPIDADTIRKIIREEVKKAS